MEKKIDVAILGGGLAGNLLARQLKLQKPELSISVFERDVERGFKVGESTVEIAANYLIRKQKLSRYLYMRQLPKNSLRFFFDNEERSAELTQMSEIGVYHMPPLPSFQLDRARLEEDLIEMNREMETEVLLGAVVKSVELGEGGSTEHSIQVQYEGELRNYKARWVIDAAGRASMLSKMLDLRVPTPEHQICASWGRGAKVADMDAWPDEGWRKKARYTARSLSTNHFCYDGYWIWFIPLSSNLISLGAVCEKSKWKPERFKKEGFMSFLREHKACASMLEDADLIDMGSYTQLSYRTKKFWDAEKRWACIGDSGAFTDPFYSPGSDFIAIEADCITDMIEREMKGEDIKERASLYDEFVQWRYETTLLLYAGLYPTFGSFELYREKCYFDCASYYNLWVDGYMQDSHLDPKSLRHTLRRKTYVLEAMKNFNNYFQFAADELRKDGRYFRGNLGNDVLNGVQAFGVFEGLGNPRSHREVNERTELIFNKAHESVQKILQNESMNLTTGINSYGKTELRVGLEAFMGDVDLAKIDRRLVGLPNIDGAINSTHGTMSEAMPMMESLTSSAQSVAE